jgi:hypothetical protein
MGAGQALQGADRRRRAGGLLTSSPSEPTLHLRIHRDRRREGGRRGSEALAARPTTDARWSGWAALGILRQRSFRWGNCLQNRDLQALPGVGIGGWLND